MREVMVEDVLARQQAINKTKTLLQTFAHGNGHCAVQFDNRGWPGASIHSRSAQASARPKTFAIFCRRVGSRCCLHSQRSRITTDL